MEFSPAKLALWVFSALTVLSAFTANATYSFASPQLFTGEIIASADNVSFERVELLISGDVATAIFNATSATTRIETISDNSRIVRGRNLHCYEYINSIETEVVVEHTCKMFVEYGGVVSRPAN